MSLYLIPSGSFNEKGGLEGSDTLRRLCAALNQAQEDDIFIVSGGYVRKDQSQPDAGMMRTQLVKWGVPSNHILMEQSAKDTWQNAEFVIELLKHLFGDAILDQRVTVSTEKRQCKRVEKSLRSFGWRGEIKHIHAHTAGTLGTVLEWAFMCLHHWDTQGTGFLARKNRARRTFDQIG